MTKNKLKYYIYAPTFNENVGGIIVLHKLCDLLNQNGEEAYLVLSFKKKPIFRKQKTLIKKIFFPFKFLKYYLKMYRTEKTSPALDTPIVYGDQFSADDSVVVYSETVNGNPLKAKNVVRWLLHKPGFLTGEIDYGLKDIFFYYQIKFNDKDLNPYEDHQLTVSWLRDDIYKQTNFSKRNGTCYILRKGKQRTMVHNVKDSILLDGKSHVEIAKIMNDCEYFLSYDMTSMYSRYAVLCGCKSIVIPKEGVSKKEWQPKEELRYGIAYGFDDIEEADKTKHLMYESMQKQENGSNQSVVNFIEKTYKFFTL